MLTEGARAATTDRDFGLRLIAECGKKVGIVAGTETAAESGPMAKTCVGDHPLETKGGLLPAPPLERSTGEGRGTAMKARVSGRQVVENALGSRGAIEGMGALVVETARRMSETTWSGV